MSSKGLKSFLCAAALGACGVIGTPAYGTAFYDGSWDPPLFRGAFEVSIDDACILQSNGSYQIHHPGVCDLQLLFLDFFDSSGSEWKGIPGPLGVPNSNDNVVILNNDLFSFSAFLSPLRLTQISGTPESCGFEGDGLAFSTSGSVTFDCGNLHDTSTRGYIPLARDPGNIDDSDGEPAIPGSVPEPATLALVAVGLVGLAASRRRKLT